MSKTKDSVDFFAIAKKEEAQFVDFRFTDINGKVHHVTRTIDSVSNDLLEEGLSFDGSSIQGWKDINNSDMVLRPDLSTVLLDPFFDTPTLSVTCDIWDPYKKDFYNRDPRQIAKLAEEYLKSTNIADSAFFGPELEFFVFDSIRFNAEGHKSFYEIDSCEFPSNNSAMEEYSQNLGHRPHVKGGYFPLPPIDALHDIRIDMLKVMQKCGIKAFLGHHEVAPAQCELGFEFNTLVNSADISQSYKYIVKNVARLHGKTATFMPKPLFGDNGSGMHVHQSLWKGSKTLFAGKDQCGLSELALYYIGGIIKHAKAINAFTNPSTNSYKRLVPGFEAPVLLAYSNCNRSASIRIPYSTSDKAKRIEVRFPDPSSNPYLAFSAMLMAGLDGIKHKIHPGDARNEDLYELSDKKQAKIPHVADSLTHALDALDKDRKFLLQGDVFTDDFIDSYIELKKKDLIQVEMRPHPMEFNLYYSC